MRRGRATQRLLVLDDDVSAARAIKRHLSLSVGYDVDTASTCGSAKKMLAEERYDAAVLDYVLPDGTALDVLRFIRERELGVPSVVLTAHGSIEFAVEVIKAGAEHFLCKPTEMTTLQNIIDRLIESSKAKRNQTVRRKLDERDEINPFVGSSAAISKLQDLALRITHVASPVLLLGETGTGKTILARWLHAAGPRCAEPFVDINCASVPDGLLEAELFGYERGAFTGAVSKKPGLFEMANRGTLFLDEIGDLPRAMQPKLLKVLEDGRVRRIGSLQTLTVDVRIIAASNRNLKELLREGSFRADLYYRLNAVPLTVPSLRHRVEDIPDLARVIVRRLSAELGRKPMELSAEALRSLSRYAWPGNIRELRNVLERTLLFDPSDGGLADALPDDSDSWPPTEPMVEDFALRNVERRHIERVLQFCDGQVAEAAKLLEVPRSTLYQKLKRMTADPLSNERSGSRRRACPEG